jgi:hypothetical protein
MIAPNQNGIFGRKKILSNVLGAGVLIGPWTTPFVGLEQFP